MARQVPALGVPFPAFVIDQQSSQVAVYDSFIDLTGTALITVSLSGVSSTADAGTLIAGISESITLTGVSAAAQVGTLSTGSTDVSLTGVSSSTDIGSLTPEIDVEITGVESASAVGALTIGTGRDVALTGVAAASAAGSLISEAGATLTGVEAATAPGTLSVEKDVNVGLTGVAASTDIALLGLDIDGNIFLPILGVQSDTGIGMLASGRASTLTGVQAAAGIGQVLVTVTQNLANIVLIGTESDTGVGSVATEVGAVITGVQGTGQVGNIIAFPSAGGLSLTDLTCDVFPVATDDYRVTLRWSDTDGNSWSDSAQRSIGTTGQYLTNPQWRRLGMSRRGRVFELEWSAPQPTALLGATVSYEDAST